MTPLQDEKVLRPTPQPLSHHCPPVAVAAVVVTVWVLVQDQVVGPPLDIELDQRSRAKLCINYKPN
jgi:hypothetical protein